MRLLIPLRVTLAVILSWPLIVAAQPTDNGEILKEPFRAARLNLDEKTLLQTGLALLGYFAGPIDGRWGVGSQQAIENYAWRKFHDTPKAAAISSLVTDFEAEVREHGWNYEYLPEIDLSLPLPEGEVTRTRETGDSIKWQRVEGGLAVEFRRHSFSELGHLHAEVVQDSELVRDRYELHEEDQWISRAQHHNGDVYYVLSRRGEGAWFSLELFAPASDEMLLNSIAAAIRPGHPEDWNKVPGKGYVSRIIETADSLAKSGQ